jgi:hypothetical protein
MIRGSNYHRRNFLRTVAAGLAGLSLPALPLPASEKRPVRAKACILLYMDGGPSHIDLFDLKPEAPAEIRGPYRHIGTSVPGTHVCEHLPRLARQMHHVAQIRSVTHEETVHDPAVYQMLTGYKHISSAGGLKVEETDLPHASCALSQADATPAAFPKAIETPEAMAMERRVLPGQNAGILSPAYDPFRVYVTREGVVFRPDFERQAEISLERLAARAKLLDELNGRGEIGTNGGVTERLEMFRRQAQAIVSSPSAQHAFDLDREPTELRELYGRHRHGQTVLLARRLVEAGARFVTVYWGNEEQDWADGKGMRLANNPWDTHRNHFPLTTDSLLPRADQTLAALLEDLADRGLLSETLVVWMGDFGRTPRISKPWASRDHWPFAFTVLMAGAGITGGAIHGKTDGHAAYVVDNPVTPADLTATIFDALGVAPDTVVASAAGRPHRLSTGRVLRELWATG